MLQILLTIYGIVALVRGKFHVGQGKLVVGGRARILGALAASTIPLGLLMGVVFIVLDGMHVMPMPEEGPLRFLDFGIIIAVAIAVVMLGKRFYRQQEEELALEAQAVSSASPQYYAVVDPTNPFASPSVKD